MFRLTIEPKPFKALLDSVAIQRLKVQGASFTIRRPPAQMVSSERD
jgi:hypothetical protein